MNALTTPIAIPNVQKMKVVAVALDGDNLVGTVTVSVQGSAGRVYNVVTLTVRDGPSQGVRATATPIGFLDAVELFTVATPTAFSDLVTAYTGGIGARNKATETALIAAGLMPAGTVT